MKRGRSKAVHRNEGRTVLSAGEKRSFTSWKLEIQNAMMFDGRLNATTFRIATYILSCVNAETKAAYVTDKTITLLLPKCRSRTTISDARKLLAKHGWISFEAGRSGRATVYRFNDGNINSVFDVVADKRDWRDAQRQKKRLDGNQCNVHKCER